MRVWDMPTRRAASRSGSDAVADVIGCIGAPDFESVALQRFTQAIDAGSWSVYRVYPDRPPVLCASASLGIPDTTHDCFRVYHAGLYRDDNSFFDARSRTLDDGPVMAHCGADDIQAAQREQIYRRYGMRERLSIVGVEPEGLLAVNLYRHAHQARFDDADIEALQQLGLGLLACIRRHLALTCQVEAAAEPLAALRSRCPTLTDRELQVCACLLRGWTHDGIALELGLSVTTIKTYRNRAFDRLGIHFRNQLFDIVRSNGTSTTH